MYASYVLYSFNLIDRPLVEKINRIDAHKSEESSQKNRHNNSQEILAYIYMYIYVAQPDRPTNKVIIEYLLIG